MEWKPEDHVDGKSILLQVMAWCHQAGDHYLNQCWPSSMTQYGVPWPQSRCVNIFWWNFQDRSEIIQGTEVFQWGMDHHLDPHNSEAIISAMAIQITDVLIVCSTICSGADQRKHQNSASFTFVRGIHRWPMDSWEMFIYFRVAAVCCTVINIFESIMNPFTDTLLSILKPQA